MVEVLLFIQELSNNKHGEAYRSIGDQWHILHSNAWNLIDRFSIMHFSILCNVCYTKHCLICIFILLNCVPCCEIKCDWIITLCQKSVWLKIINHIKDIFVHSCTSTKKKKWQQLYNIARACGKAQGTENRQFPVTDQKQRLLLLRCFDKSSNTQWYPRCAALLCARCSISNRHTHICLTLWLDCRTLTVHLRQSCFAVTVGRIGTDVAWNDARKRAEEVTSVVAEWCVGASGIFYPNHSLSPSVVIHTALGSRYKRHVDTTWSKLQHLAHNGLSDGLILCVCVFFFLFYFNTLMMCRYFAG